MPYKNLTNYRIRKLCKSMLINKLYAFFLKTQIIHLIKFAWLHPILLFHRVPVQEFSYPMIRVYE